MKRSLLAVTLCMVSASVCAQDLGPSGGTICGNVRDETGQPAARVRVAAVYSGGTSGMRPSAVTDRQGRYCIADLMFGGYTMSASDPEKGYPEMQAAFYARRMPGQPVTVTYKKPNAHSDFQIPFKAGFLQVVLTDALSGKVIANMLYHLADSADPQSRWIDGSSASSHPLLVPPGRPVTLSVTSPGYSNWPNGGTSAHTLTLAQGETRVLRIELRRSP